MSGNVCVFTFLLRVKLSRVGVFTERSVHVFGRSSYLFSYVVSSGILH